MKAFVILALMAALFVENAIAEGPLSITPEVGGVTVGYDLLSPRSYTWGEWLTLSVAAVLAADQIANSGSAAQEVIDWARNKPSSSPSLVDIYGDRDFARATAGTCEGAALHSKDISLHRASSGSCIIDISSPTEASDE